MGGCSGPEFFEGGGGVRVVQVRGNFHILTSKKNNLGGGGLNPLPPPPPWIHHCFLIQHYMSDRVSLPTHTKKLKRFQCLVLHI